MKQHITRRTINGLTYFCTDTGCPDFDRAAENREIIKHKLYILGYLEAEGSRWHKPFVEQTEETPKDDLPEIEFGKLNKEVQEVRDRIKRGDLVIITEELWKKRKSFFGGGGT